MWTFKLINPTHKFLKKNLKEILKMLNVDSIPALWYLVVNKVGPKVLLFHTFIRLQQRPAGLGNLKLKSVTVKVVILSIALIEPVHVC